MSTEVGRIHYELGLDTSKFDNATSKIGKKLGSMGSAMVTVAKRTAAVGIAMGTLAAVIGVKTNAELETANLQFETLMGSADKAKKHVKSLFDFAKKTPFETKPIIDASLKLQAFGGAALNTEKNLKLVGDAAAAVSANIDEVAFWVGRAYAMIKSGKPFGEAAMRLQELAILSPKARDEMEKLQASGASSEVVFSALQKELGKFNGAMAKQAETMKGLSSTLMDIIKLDLGYIFEPLFHTTKKALSAVVAFADTPAWQKIKDKARSTIGVVAEYFNGIIEATQKGGLQAGLAKAAEGFSKFGEAVVNWLSKVDFGGIMTNVLMGLFKALGNIDFGQFAGLFTTIFISIIKATDWVELAATATPIMIKAIADIIEGVITGLIRWLRDDPVGFIITVAGLIFMPAKWAKAIAVALGKIPLIGWLLGWITKVLNGLGTGIRASVSGFVSGWIKFLKEAILYKLIGAQMWLRSTGIKVVSGLTNGIRSMGNAVWNAIKSVADKIGSFFKGAWRWLFDTGKAIVQGLINGIKNMVGAVNNAAGEVGSAVANKIKSVLGIRSPSRVMFGFGQNIAQGLVNGIDSGMKSVENSMGMLSSAATGGVISAGRGSNYRNETNINGNIILNNKQDVDYFFDRLNRNSELARKGLATI